MEATEPGTSLGGSRSMGIHTKTIGFAGVLWILWNSNKVQVTQLAMSEQEIHVLAKVIFSTFEFMCFAVYASPKFHERCILWNNLKKCY